MTGVCIVVADGSRARLFELTYPQQPEFESGPDLREIADLAAPQHAGRDQAIYSEGITGRNRTVAGGGHDYDEHRDGHDSEVERQFARDILADLASRSAERNILCASPRMMGYLRDAMSHVAGLAVTEVQKDLTGQDPRRIQEQLADQGLLPARRPPGA